VKRFISFLGIGILFGIVMTKSEAISWYRIYEMFNFQSFHMYGIIAVALLGGIAVNYLVRRYEIKTVEGDSIQPTTKSFAFKRNLLGGIVFGLGWALSGACPGPMYTMIGNGFSIFIVIIAFALLGAYAYGAFSERLPH